MQSSDWLQFGIGALLGLSAVPHCLVMCSGIATAFSMAGEGSARDQRWEILTRSVVSNLGRILSYAAAGGIVGGLGVAAFSWLDATLANITLRWLAAILLSLVGLSLAGIMPAPIVAYPNGLLAGSVGLSRCGFGGSRSYIALFTAGCVWGFMPCAMAYSALFYAMTSGSPLRGMLTMSGFGFATLAPMILPALGVSMLSRFGAKQRMRVILGLVLAAVGFIGTLNSVHDFGVWCRT
jgi:sulfite exporter TauE/SafE